MNRWVILAGAIVAAAVCGGVYLRATSDSPVQAARVGRGEIREYVDERAKTRLPDTYVVSMPFAARIKPITLREGDLVKAGQAVAQITDADVEDAVAEMDAVVQRLDAAIAEKKDISVEQRARQQAEQLVRSMAAAVKAGAAVIWADGKRLDYAKHSLERTRRLAAKNAKTEDELEQAEVEQAESEAASQRDALLVEALRATAAAVDLLPPLVDDFIGRRVLSQAVLEQQKEEAEARLRQMITRRQRAQMTSPVDGVVLQRLVNNERFLSAGTELMRIGRLEELEIEADILSQDVVRIVAGDQGVGNEVEIYGPAVGAGVGQGLRGWVHRVRPAGFTKISSLGVEQQRVKVIVRFGPEVWLRLLDQNVGVDFRVRVRIFTGVRPSALIAPRSALFRGDGGVWSTYVIRRGRVETQEVVVGLMNDEHVEIRDGVQEGELVVIAPENSLRPGDRVRAVEIPQPTGF